MPLSGVHPARLHGRNAEEFVIKQLDSILTSVWGGGVWSVADLSSEQVWMEARKSALALFGLGVAHGFFSFSIRGLRK